jgi:hypothetical protein
MIGGHSLAEQLPLTGGSLPSLRAKRIVRFILPVVRSRRRYIGTFCYVPLVRPIIGTVRA